MRIGDIDISLRHGIRILNKEAVKTETHRNVITERQLHRQSADLGRWRAALTRAESAHVPNRTELMRIYQELVLDNHLSSLIQMRTEKILAHKVQLCDVNGDVNDEATAMLQKSWFRKMIKLSLESKWYGYSLIQFDQLESNVFDVVELVPREYIEPSQSIVKREPFVLDGIRYDEEPVNNWTFFVGGTDLGILNKLAPVAIWKKNALGAWAEYIDIFGIPPRIGRTDVLDKKLKDNMFNMLKNMGRMSFGVFGHDDEIQLVESKGQGDPYQVFDKMVERTNSEMSKLITGGTMTADDGSSRSQSEVHERGFEALVRADLRWLEDLMNERFIKWLSEKHDFPFDGLTFKFDLTERLELTDQMEITKELLDHYKIPADWINERFGIPVEEITPSSPDPQDFFFSIRRQVFDQYASFKMQGDPDKLLSPDEEDDLFRAIFSGSVSVFALPRKLYEATAKAINKVVNKGFGGDVGDFPTGSEKHNMIRDLKTNVFKFSAGKTFHNVREMQSQLRDSAGNFRPFEEFRDEAKKIFDEFNEHHLAAELNTARSQAEAAESWINIQDQKDVFPVLVYRTQLDNRVRVEHQELEGIRAKVDSSFWASNYPPNGYNCRCFVEQSSSDKNLTDLNNLSDVVMQEFDSVDPVFRMNAGKDREIFSNKHPYFKAPKGFKEQRDNNHNLPIPFIG